MVMGPSERVRGGREDVRVERREGLGILNTGVQLDPRDRG